MSKIFAVGAAVIAATVASAAAQNNYMKAAPSNEPAAKSAPAKGTKKAPTISSKCQSPGTNKPASC